MDQIEKARRFAALHVKGKPVVLYNVWDAGGAKAVVGAGAEAVATGSLSVAAAHGFPDRQAIPMELLLTIAARIVETVEVPVSIDFEGAYAVEPEATAANVARLADIGVVGVNFEDQVVGGEGLHPIDVQAARIRAVRAMAEARGLPFFINARTDLFLKQRDGARQREHLAEAKERAAAYAEAGASGYFIPGLVGIDHIAGIVEATDLPVNVLMLAGVPAEAELAARGVARISHGPGPYFKAMAELAERAKPALAAASG